MISKADNGTAGKEGRGEKGGREGGSDISTYLEFGESLLVEGFFYFSCLLVRPQRLSKANM